MKPDERWEVQWELWQQYLSVNYKSQNSFEPSVKSMHNYKQFVNQLFCFLEYVGIIIKE